MQTFAGMIAVNKFYLSLTMDKGFSIIIIPNT